MICRLVIGLVLDSALYLIQFETPYYYHLLGTKRDAITRLAPGRHIDREAFAGLQTSPELLISIRCSGKPV